MENTGVRKETLKDRHGVTKENGALETYAGRVTNPSSRTRRAGGGMPVEDDQEVQC